MRLTTSFPFILLFGITASGVIPACSQPASGGLNCTFGVGNDGFNFEVIQVASCEGSCGQLLTASFGTPFLVYGCFPDQLVSDLNLTLFWALLPNITGILANACNDSDNCNQPIASPSEPVSDTAETQISCYNGLWSKGKPLSDVGYRTYRGNCMSVTLVFQNESATFYTCMPNKLVLSLNLFERCDVIEEDALYGCGCNRTNCIDPTINKYPTGRPTIAAWTTPQPTKCPTGWIASSSVTNKCYRLYNGSATFDQAMQACRSQFPQSTLITIQNGFENNNIQGSRDVWIGLHADNGNWTWTDGSTSSYRNWDNGFPYGNNECTSLISNGKWWSFYCNEKMSFVCELSGSF